MGLAHTVRRDRYGNHLDALLAQGLDFLGTRRAPNLPIGRLAVVDLPRLFGERGAHVFRRFDDAVYQLREQLSRNIGVFLLLQLRRRTGLRDCSPR